MNNNTKQNTEKLMPKYYAYNPKTKKMERRELKIKSTKEGTSLKKSIIFLIFIIFELAIILFFYTRFILYLKSYFLITIVLSLLAVIRVVVSNKNPDSKIAWIIFLLIFFPIGFLVYLLVGELSCSPFKIRRTKKINLKYQSSMIEEIQKDLPIRIFNDMNFLKNTTGFIPYFNSETKYFSTGEKLFSDIIKELTDATDFIFMEYFIIEEGKLMEKIIDILKRKASEGVDVRIILDGLGSQNTISYKTYKKIKNYGIKIAIFGPMMPLLNIFMNYRDHRKIVIIDKNIAYLSGANMADEYVNEKERFGWWKDEGIKIEGAAVNSITIMFLKMWEYINGKDISYQEFLNNDNRESNKEEIIIPFSDSPNETNAVARWIYQSIITNAKKYVYIMTPYLILDNGLLETLKNKALSGIDIRIIIPAIPDKKIVYSLTLANAEKLHQYGVKIYIYTPGFIHSKVIISDDECAVVGSINMDFRSFYQQYESGVYLSETKTLLSIKQDFIETFIESKEIEMIKKKNIVYRIWISLLCLFAPLM